MNRRELWLALLAFLPAGLCPRRALGLTWWLKGAAALFRMLRATRTMSRAYRVTRSAATRRSSGFSGASLSRPRSRPQRLSRDEFRSQASKQRLAGVSPEDRKKVDRNLWDYIDTVADLGDAMHLAEQWGVEGISLSRTEHDNIRHVEGCTVCIEAYVRLVDDTTLGCNSSRLGDHVTVKDKAPPDAKSVINRKVTIPP